MDLPDRLVDAEMVYSDPEAQADGKPLREAAADRVRLMLILKKIARREGFSVDRDDVARRIGELAAESGIAAHEQAEYLDRNGVTERLADALLAEQVLDYLAGAQQ